jgi:RND family efflux transporter MFP subunit
MTSVDPDLVKQLRIASDDREDAGTGHDARIAWIVGGAAAAVVALAAAGGAWWWFAARALPVQTAVATASGSGATAGAVLQATGYLTARRRATVSAQITGTLTQVLIEEGDHVAAGQVLARLEDSAFRAARDAARSAVEAAKAQVSQAQIQLAQAQADARRSDELVQSGMTTRQLAEQARSNVNVLTAVLEARRREQDSAEAQLAQAQVNFDYTVVRAPFAGVITDKAAQVGEIISPLSAGGGFTRTGVGTIVDMDSIEVEVDVAEASIAQIKPDMPAEAVIDAYPDWHIPAHVIAVVPEADRGKATVKVRVALEQKDARLVPDIGVRVSFLGQKPSPQAVAQPRGALVPPAAVVQRDGHAVVFVVADGRATQKTVTAAPQGVGSMTLLTAGVEGGDRVVVSPPDSLRDGAHVADDAAH